MLAIVTGGSRGIGMGIARGLLDSGYDVIITARSESEQVAQLSKDFVGRVTFLSVDISCKESRDLLADYIDNNSLKIDLLVNNAGVAPKVRRDMLDISEEDFDYVLDINLKGTYFMTQLIANHMTKNNQGRIVNISSVSAYTASVKRGEYCVAKAGISMITKLFAVRMAEFNVGVFEIRPGVIDTDMTSGVRDTYVKMIEDGLTPVKRMGTPSDISGCVNSIASGAMDFCTGSVFDCDGGFSIRRL